MDTNVDKLGIPLIPFPDKLISLHVCLKIGFETGIIEAKATSGFSIRCSKFYIYNNQ